MNTTETRVTAIFPDGAMLEAESYEDLETMLKEDAWNPSQHDKYRMEMTLRALNWSRWQLNPKARAEAFVKGLEKAGILRLVTEEER